MDKLKISVSSRKSTSGQKLTKVKNKKKKGFKKKKKLTLEQMLRKLKRATLKAKTHVRDK